jgi:protein disulfide-isomerase
MTLVACAALVWSQNVRPGGSGSKPATSSAPASKPTTFPAAAAGKWTNSAPEAAALAKASGRLILADFTGSDWCGWCKRLKAEVFDTKEFHDWSAKNVVLLEVDFPQSIQQPDGLKRQNQNLQKAYNISGYPTILFLNADGKIVGKSGYMDGGPKNWIDNAQRIIDKAKEN